MAKRKEVKDDPRWSNPEIAFDREERDDLVIAMCLYNAGGGTVDSLAQEWSLTRTQRNQLMRLVKKAWAEGKWTERRKVERRQTLERRTP